MAGHSVLQAIVAVMKVRKLLMQTALLSQHKRTSSSADLPQISVRRAHADLGQQAVEMWDVPA
jgi:hypothetical protein